MTAAPTLDTLVREALQKYSRLKDLSLNIPANEDLYAAGMTSHCSVNLMLALEASLDLEFPDHMLTRSVFASVASITAALESLGAQVG